MGARGLTRSGTEWHLDDGAHKIVIVPTNEVRVLAGFEASTAVRRLSSTATALAPEMVRLAEALSIPTPGFGRPDPEDIQRILQALADALDRGGLVALEVSACSPITEAEIQMLEERRRKRSIPAPPYRPPPPEPEESLHRYLVRVVDDTGAPVPGVKLKLEIAGTPRMQTTAQDGRVTVEWFSRAPASLRVLEQSELERRLEASWGKDRCSDLPSGPDVHALTVGSPFEPIAVPVDSETTLIVCRPGVHAFEVVAYDSFGQVLPGVGLVLSVDGGEQTVTTDEDGRATYDGASDRTASARLANYEQVQELLLPRWTSPPPQSDLGAIADAVPLVLGADQASLALKSGEPIKIVFRRNVVRVRLIGMFFDHAKTFLLPSALEGIRKLCGVYSEHPNANLLLVGHTDTKHREDSDDDGSKFNKRLSLDRAKAVEEFLTNDVEGWYAWYNVTGERCWGDPEDTYMLSNVPPGQDPYYHQGDNRQAAVKNYQANSGLPVTGVVAELTRHALIRDYMSADDTTLPAGVTTTTHGCGPHFPDVDTGPNDDVPKNRRVEIFVFDGPILPPPPGDYSEPGSPEYPAWVAQVGETIDFDANAEQSTDDYPFSL